MPKKGVDDLVSRAVNDPQFRARLLANPDDVVLDEGYELEPDVMEKLRTIDPEAAEAAAREIEEDFGNSKVAA